MYFIGIDVSTKESALCILDGKGKIVRETKLPTDPEIIARFIAATGLAIERIGLESGCTAAWLFAGLQRYGWPVICIDARHAAAALQAGFRNKNDRNDARGIADLMRVNKYRPVWVKSPEAQRQGRLLTARATLQTPHRPGWHESGAGHDRCNRSRSWFLGQRRCSASMRRRAGDN